MFLLANIIYSYNEFQLACYPNFYFILNSLFKLTIIRGIGPLSIPYSYNVQWLALTFCGYQQSLANPFHISISIKTLNTLQKNIFIIEKKHVLKAYLNLNDNSLTFFIIIVKHGNLYLLLLSFYPAQLSIQLELCILFNIPISMPNKIDYLLNHDKNISNLFGYSFYPSSLPYIMQGFYRQFTTFFCQLF